jgi:hypothetical protein
LATINSQHKDSVRPEPASINKGVLVSKISHSIEYESPAQPARIQKVESASKNKENLYTDPKLLEMIRKDLEDINKLKQSTLKETIKYSFLYPESDSIFKSIQDVKLSSKHKQSTQKLEQPEPLEDSVGNESIPNEFVGDHPSAKDSTRKSGHIKEEILKFCRTVDLEGLQYEGYMLDGLKHGSGKLAYQDGGYYDGEFQDDKMHGRGILYYG